MRYVINFQFSFLRMVLVQITLTMVLHAGTEWIISRWTERPQPNLS